MQPPSPRCQGRSKAELLKMEIESAMCGYGFPGLTEWSKAELLKMEIESSNNNGVYQPGVQWSKAELLKMEIERAYYVTPAHLWYPWSKAELLKMEIESSYDSPDWLCVAIAKQSWTPENGDWKWTSYSTNTRHYRSQKQSWTPENGDWKDSFTDCERRSG